MTKKKMYERLSELYYAAAARFLNKIDFDVYEWLEYEEREEYEKLMIKTGQQEKGYR